MTPSCGRSDGASRSRAACRRRSAHPSEAVDEIGLVASGDGRLRPLAVVFGAVLTRVGGEDIAERIIDRYELTEGGADAVSDVFSPAGGTSTSVGVIGAAAARGRGVELHAGAAAVRADLGARSAQRSATPSNGARWAIAFVAYVLATGWIHAVVGGGRLELVASLLVLPVTAVFLVWSGWILSAKRIPWQDLPPFGVIASILTAVYSVGATVYLLRLFSSYATRYGVIGAVFAMISALFCVMLIVVGSATLGREVSDELDRIRRGERPPDRDVRRQWNNLLDETRSRWRAARERIDHRPDRKQRR